MGDERRVSDLETILSEGLDLCVRARRLDELTQELPADHPENTAGYPITRCATPALWVREQYDSDLADWEKRARSLMMQGKHI